MTIDQLAGITASQRKKSKIVGHLREGLMIGVFLICAYMAVTIFTNAPLFLASVQGLFIGVETGNAAVYEMKSGENGSIFSVIDQEQEKSEEISALIEKYTNGEQEIPVAQDPELLLAQQRKGYDFSFNILPPTNRLIVPKFGVDDPVITSQYTNMDDFIYKNYNEELKQGVVKYPTTPAPGETGNTLLFGHTSEEWWKNNPFSMAFAHIAELQLGDEIQVIWNGKKYYYHVKDIQVKYPKDVNAAYLQYTNRPKNYLTMMGCYPIGTSKQRILIFAEQVEK